MARNFSSGDAKQLTRRYQDLSSQMARVDTLAQRQTAAIQAAAAAMTGESSKELLQTVPVDELNRITARRSRNRLFRIIRNFANDFPVFFFQLRSHFT